MCGRHVFICLFLLLQQGDFYFDNLFGKHIEVWEICLKDTAEGMEKEEKEWRKRFEFMQHPSVCKYKLLLMLQGHSAEDDEVQNATTASEGNSTERRTTSAMRVLFASDVDGASRSNTASRVANVRSGRRNATFG